MTKQGSGKKVPSRKVLFSLCIGEFCLLSIKVSL
jgi:hypothetical protein